MLLGRLLLECPGGRQHPRLRDAPHTPLLARWDACRASRPSVRHPVLRPWEQESHPWGLLLSVLRCPGGFHRVPWAALLVAGGEDVLRHWNGSASGMNRRGLPSGSSQTSADSRTPEWPPGHTHLRTQRRGAGAASTCRSPDLADAVLEFCLVPGRSWSTWSSTLKHRSLGIGSQCSTEGRTSTQPCPSRSGGRRWVLGGGLRPGCDGLRAGDRAAPGPWLSAVEGSAVHIQRQPLRTT